MVSRFRPMEMEVRVADRSYKLGGTVDIAIELTPRGTVEVREGRVDLVCEERYSEVNTVMVPVNRGIVRTGTGHVAPTPRASVPKQVTTEHRDTYVHSSVIFLQNATLERGVLGTYKVRLDIGPNPPRQPDKATVKWTLVTFLDVARARDVTKKQPITIDTG